MWNKEVERRAAHFNSQRGFNFGMVYSNVSLSGSSSFPFLSLFWVSFCPFFSFNAVARPKIYSSIKDRRWGKQKVITLALRPSHEELRLMMRQQYGRDLEKGEKRKRKQN